MANSRKSKTDPEEVQADQPETVDIDAAEDTTQTDVVEDSPSDVAENLSDEAPEDTSDADMPVSESEDPVEAESEPESDESKTVEAEDEAALSDGDADDVTPDTILEPDALQDTLGNEEIAKPAETDVPPAAPPVAQPAKSGGGLLGGVIGGAVAAIAILALAPSVLPQKWFVGSALDSVAADMGQQTDRIGTLETDLGALKETASGALSAADIDAVTASVSALETSTGDGLASLTSQIDALTKDADALATRIDALEKRPITDTDNEAQTAALSVFEREVTALREELASQMDQTNALIEKAAQESQAAKDAAAAQAADAAAKAAEAVRRQALVDIEIALEQGNTFSEPLAQLGDMDIPAELRSAAETGVPTLAALMEAFPAAARDALAVSSSVDGDGESGGRVSAFFKRQLGVRSLAPKEGTSPDAVLSRAEAAAHGGNLTDAIAELSALPQAGQDAMSAWVADAQSRAAAVDAINSLASSLTTN